MSRHRITLINVADTRRYLAGLINRLEKDDIDPKKASKLAYVVNTLLKAQELESIEKRLLLLEEAAERREAIDVTPKPKLIEEKKP